MAFLLFVLWRKILGKYGMISPLAGSIGDSMSKYIAKFFWKVQKIIQIFQITEEF